MAAQDKPNIIFIMTDQHRFDCLGSMGHPILKTEHIDQLAKEGMIFDNAYCPSPICGPARAAIFSGNHAAKNGHYHNWTPFHPGVTLLTDHLYHRGYYNAMVGKLHLHPTSSRHGFDWKMLCDSPHDIYCRDEVVYNPYIDYVANEKFKGDKEAFLVESRKSEQLAIDDYGFWQGWSYVEDPLQMTTWTGDTAINFIDHWSQEKPLFMHISFFGPHHPYSTCEPWDSMYDPDQIELPDTFDISKNGPIFDCKKSQREKFSKWNVSIWKKMIAQYYGNISAIDKQVGRIIESLKRNGLFDNSMIIFTSDHGDHMGDFALLGKGDMYDTSVKIPMIIKMPGSVNAGMRKDKVVNSLDLFQTLLDVSGNNSIDDEFPRDSRSMLGILRGDENSWENHTFSMMATNPNQFTTMIRQDNLKLIRFKTPDDVLYEAYDLQDETKDVRDIFHDRDYHNNIKIMKRKLDVWSEEQYKRHPLVNGYAMLSRPLVIKDL